MPATATVNGVDGTAFLVLFAFSVCILAWTAERVLSKLSEIAAASRVLIQVSGDGHVDVHSEDTTVEEEEEDEEEEEEESTTAEQPTVKSQ